MADAIGMAQSFVESLAPVASFAGIDLGSITTGLGDMRDGLEANVTQLEAMRDGLRDSTQYQRDLIEANNEALGMRQAERVDEIVQVYDELDQAITSTASSQRGFNFELTETGRRQREVASATAAATAAIQEEGTFWSTMQSGIATAREQAQLAMDKETLSRTAAIEAMKAEVRAMAELRAELDILNGSMPDWSASMNASLDSIATQFSPLNQAMGVFKEGAGAMAEGVATSFVDAALSGEKVGKAFKRQMGDMLVAQGSASIMQGVLSMIPFMPSFNPVGGAAYIAQGGIMLAAGKLMTGGKGGGGGQGLAATGAGVVPTPSTPSVNNNSNVTVNNAFGIVGDQRQSARLVVDSLRFAQAEGL